MIMHTDDGRFSLLSFAKLALQSLDSGLERRDIAAFFTPCKLVIRA